MISESRKVLNRRRFLTAAGGFGLGFSLSSLAGAAMLVRDRDPSLTVLGSGDNLSALVSAGGARVLILQGTNATEFGNAYSRSRPPLLDRADLLVVADPEANIGFVTRVADQIGSPLIAVLGSGESLMNAGVQVRYEFTLPHRLALPAGMALTLPSKVGPADAAPGEWVATVTCQAMTVLISCGPGEDIEGLPRNPAVWIRLDGSIGPEALSRIYPSAVIIPASAMSGPELRADLATLPAGAVPGFRVHSGDAARLRFADGQVDIDV